MKRKDLIVFVGLVLGLVLIFSGCSTSNTSGISDRALSFNAEWKFIRDSVAGAEQVGFDDSNWLLVDLPHDYSMMDLPGEDGPDQVGPFTKNTEGTGSSTGHVLGGTGWYRKSFTLDKRDEGKTAILNFDGVYMESEVWVNGQKAGIHKNGYTPFWFDITSLLNDAGEANVIAVKVENTGRNSRWYSGSGIYRNVRLTLVQPVHVAEWGVKVTTPEIKQNSAMVDVEVSVQNEKEEEVNADLTIQLIDQDGNLAAEAKDLLVLPGKSRKITKLQMEVENPFLWSMDSPHLYTAEISVDVNAKVSDKYKQTFGIRFIEFSAEEGFLLNGESVLLKGGCIHHDNGVLGAAAFDRAEFRKVELMKANGYNAIRTAHNPPSEAFLDACDKLGVLVIDEFTDMWEAYKNPQDYSRFFREWWDKDLSDMILRDRNHPSIIMWSIGNEVLESSDSSGVRIGGQLAEKVRELDNTRVVTAGISEFFTPGGWENSAAAFEVLEVGGYQYNWTKYEPDHQKFPERIMYASESYPLDAYDSWKAAEKLPYVVGDFVWTSMDYMGEVFIGNSSYSPEGQQTIMEMPEGFQMPAGMNVFDLLAMAPPNWPDYISGCGDLDISGEKKPQILYRDVLWDNSKLEINVHTPIPEGYVENINKWGWPDEWPIWDWKGSEGKELQVRVFTKASQVKLELNGKVIGERTLSEADKYIAVFEVPYQAGELKAIAFENGNEVASKILKTPGEPVDIRMIADRDLLKADRNDLGFITIEVIDANGQRLMQDSASIKITVSGNGELVGSGNASDTDMGSVNRLEIKTFKGKAQAIIRPFAKTGPITVRAESEGLAPFELTIGVD